jgi:4-diphosphocytidyl-2-C-methyl-D-erythritol kinase
MITFPCAKINLGLNIVAERSDGYHDIETIFYPIPFTDVLEVKSMSDEFPSEIGCDLKVTGNIIDCNDNDNLVVKAYQLLAADYRIPRIYAHLYKRIPAQAGLGGGSSDAAFMIRLLDERYRLNIGNSEMEHYAARLGADCAFFIMAEPSFATGIGDQLIPADAPKGNLNGYFILIIKPKVMVSTRDAYAKITPRQPQKSCRTIVHQPISTWKDELINDFEGPAFAQYPELAAIKEKLYQSGAIYAQMSGSGSSIYGIFRKDPVFLKEVFKEDFIWSGKIYG